MTSVKCFGSWLKEAGRGHLTALFGWTTFFIYTVLLVMRLSLDTSYTFFGIGNTVLLWLSMGLGVLFSFLEFFYLLQQKKQDFYYSLPVKKGMIFWSRYTHGVIHFISSVFAHDFRMWNMAGDGRSGICSFCRKLYREKYSCVWICFFNLLSYRDFVCFGMRQFYMCSLTLCFDHCVFFFIY